MTTRTHVTIDEDVRAVLTRASMTATTVVLTEQLDRSMYQRVNKALEAAGGRWNRRARAHVFDVDPRITFGNIETATRIERRQQVLQAFYTPDADAERMVDLADIEPGHVCVEPSAGKGALVDAMLRRQPAAIVALDVDVHHVQHLRGKYREIQPSGARVIVEQCDFLELGPLPTAEPDVYRLGVVPPADRIVMNPPFRDGQEVSHVKQAYRLLRRGGVLVTVVSGAFAFRETGLYRGFADWMRSRGELAYELPAGTFEDTDVRAVVWRLVK